MSIADIFAAFRNPNHQPGGTQQPQQVIQQPTGAASAALNPTVPGSEARSDGSLPTIPKAAEGEASPLDGFLKMWDIDPKAKSPGTMAIPIPVDAKQVRDRAAQIDFTASIPQEMKDRIAKGDSAAMLQAINLVGQSAFAMSSATSAKITESALQAQERVFSNEVLPAALKRHSISQSLRTDNPAFQNPAVSPVVALIEKQLQQTYPQATAQEITQKAQEYLFATSEAILGTSTTRMVTDRVDPSKDIAGNALKRQDTDWGEYFLGAAAE